MATSKSGKDRRGGDYRRRDGWSGSRDYKPGSPSPGPRRSNSPWHSNYRTDYQKEHRQHRDSQRTYVQYLSNEWKKVEQDLQRESPKDQNIKHTVEYIEKNATEIKAEKLFDMVHFLKNRAEGLPPD